MKISSYVPHHHAIKTARTHQSSPLRVHSAMPFVPRHTVKELHAPTSTHASPSPASTPGRMIVVYGYGCDVFQKDLRHRRNTLQSIKHPSFGAVDVFCNEKEPKSMTYDIWKTLVRRRVLLEPTPFVRQIINHVCESLRRKERVTLVGHSYGGSVVSRVAMYLKNNCAGVDTSLLRVITYGSIFIPPSHVTHGISIKHVIYSNDIAKMCHKKSTSCAAKQDNVHILHPRTWNPVGSHMNYDDLIAAVAKKGVSTV